MGKIHSVRTFCLVDQSKYLLHPLGVLLWLVRVCVPGEAPRTSGRLWETRSWAGLKQHSTREGRVCRNSQDWSPPCNFSHVAPCPWPLRGKLQHRLVNLVRTGEQAASTGTHGLCSNLSNSLHATGSYSYTDTCCDFPPLSLHGRQAGFLHGKPAILFKT